MSTIALGFLKLYFWYSKKFEIKYVYTYEHSKRMVKNSEENILYFELYKKTNLWHKSIYIHSHKSVNFM
jgi:hypothetical protein